VEKNFKKLKKYWLETFFITLALFFTLTAIFIYIQSSKESNNEEIVYEKQESTNKINQSIFVDLSGEVKKPDVYKIKSGTRLKQVIDLSGGLTGQADKQYFNRNYNLARVLSDQEKVYIPSVSEINNGYFIENSQAFDYLSIKEETQPEISLIDINKASTDELDTLPGIGIVTADKIIVNRPYKTIDELLTKKVLKKNIYEEIKNLVIIN